VHLAGRFAVSGFDRAPAMLAIARRKLPGVSLWEADLESFEVETPCDAVVCMFSSIGYLADDAALRRAAGRFAAAVRPGGAVVIEPWIARGDFVDGLAHLSVHDGDDVKAARASVSRVEGEFAVVEFAWAVARRGGAAETFTETHALRFVPVERMIGIFAERGIRLRETSSGADPERGWLVGRRSA
jgi:daunosaminyl-N,N-dimethyltransferase/N-dimethyltransferase